VDLTDLFRTHRARLVRLAFAITLDAAIAEEMVQDAFLGLQRNIDRIDSPVAYLQRSVVNLSVSVIRRRRLIERRPPPSAVSPAASSPEIDEMWAKVMRLPAKQRAVVVLRFWEDLSLAEIARVLRRPSGSVKSTLHRAIQALKEDLS
jgi:RNA polymerase sigma factor (sigma-70 family)